MSRVSHFVAVIAVAGGAIAACAGGGEGSRDPSKASQSSGTISSNVTRDDYAGTDACVPCHADIVARWRAAPMHKMTRDANALDANAPFDGRSFDFHGDRATLTTDGAEHFVTLATRADGTNVYRVTKVIGGHHREDFAGQPVDSAKAGARTLGDPREELVLPVSWLIAKKTLRYKGYSVMLKERPALRAGPIWNQTCIFCHNTAPYLSTILRALAGDRAPPFQGEVTDPLLPPPARATYRVTDPSTLDATLMKEDVKIGAPAWAKSGVKLLRESIDTTREHFRADDLVELGIGCESCHLGSKAHVKDPRVVTSLWPRSNFVSVDLPGGAKPTHANEVNRACARCHQVLFSGYPFTWEGGKRHENPGGSNINSGEARDLLLGDCKNELSCVNCHDPHAPDNDAKMRAEDSLASNETCTACHKKYAAPAALASHTHHLANGVGSQCTACHMPRKNMSLDNKLTRYHRIGSPDATAKVLLDRPLECALCHQDKSVRQIVSSMQTWWKKNYDESALVNLYGSMDANVMLATLERGKPHEKAVAMYVLGESKNRDAADLAANELVNEYPIVRFYARDALEKILGETSPLDLDASDEALLLAGKAWVTRKTRPAGAL